MPNNPDPNSAAYRKRLRIAEEAVRWVGSHYLWGAAGASPGHHEGARYRTGGVLVERTQINDPSRASVGACSYTVRDKQVCCGRYRSVPGGREIVGQDAELNNYLAMLRASHAHTDYDNVPSFRGLTPRVAVWEDDNTGLTRKLVWGEDCRMKQHFDCIHFVNYVLIQCGVRLHVDSKTISWYANDAQTEPQDRRQPWAGDILTNSRNSHIGFIYDANTVVHAKQSVSGVVRESYNPAHWARLGRLRDEHL